MVHYYYYYKRDCKEQNGGHILYTVLFDEDFLGAGILHAKHAKGSNVVYYSWSLRCEDACVAGSEGAHMAVWFGSCVGEWANSFIVVPFSLSSSATFAYKLSWELPIVTFHCS